MAGKGDSHRPVDRKLFEENYERIFNNGEKHAPAPNDKTEAPEPSDEQAAHNGDSHSEDVYNRDLGQHWGREENHAVWAERHGQDHPGSDGTERGIHRL